MNPKAHPVARHAPDDTAEEVFDLDEARALAAEARDVAFREGRCVIFVSEEKGTRRLLRQWPDGRVEEWRGDGWHTL